MTNATDLPNETPQTEWYNSTGTVADRTNVVITALLDWAIKTDTTRITRNNVEDAVREFTPVDGDDTVQKYVRRVTTHGPFTATSTNQVWEIDTDQL